MDQAPADTELRNIIDKLAQFVARNGPEFEQMTKNKQKDNPKFSFLFGGEYFNYYQYKVTTEQAILKQKGLNAMQNVDPRVNLSQQHRQNATGAPIHNNINSSAIQNNGINSSSLNIPPNMANVPNPGPMAPSNSTPASGNLNNSQTPLNQGSTAVGSNSWLQNELTTLQNQQTTLQDQVRQSEQNLAAQHAALMAQQQGRVEDAVRLAQEECLLANAQNANVDIESFNAILQPIIDTCTKDSISAGKAWILQYATSPPSNEVITEHLLKKVIQESTFNHKLHIIYLVNDVLHHCARKKSVDLRRAMEKVVVPMFCNTSLAASEDQLNKLNKLLSLWESKSNYFDQGVIEKLKNPSASWSEYQSNLMSLHADSISSITATTKQTFDNYQAQHQAFVNHAMRQIQTIEQQKVAIDQQLKAPAQPMPPQNNVLPPTREPPPTSPHSRAISGPPLNNRDYGSSDNSQVHSNSLQQQNTGGHPHHTGPSHGTSMHGGPPPHQPIHHGGPQPQHGGPPHLGPHSEPPIQHGPPHGPPPHSGPPPNIPPHGSMPRGPPRPGPYMSPPHGHRSDFPPQEYSRSDYQSDYRDRPQDRPNDRSMDRPDYHHHQQSDYRHQSDYSRSDYPRDPRSEYSDYRSDYRSDYSDYHSDYQDYPPSDYLPNEYTRRDRHQSPPPHRGPPYGGGPPHHGMPHGGPPPHSRPPPQGGPPPYGGSRDGPPYGPPRDGPPYGGPRDGPYGGPDGPYSGMPFSGPPRSGPPHGGPPPMGRPSHDGPYGGGGQYGGPMHGDLPHDGQHPNSDLTFNKPPPNWSGPGPDQPPGPISQLPDFSKPPPGFSAPPPFIHESSTEDLMPSMPYFELPAGLMVPLIKLEDGGYKPLDPANIRLPPPAPPSERLIAAVEAFYAPPNHDSPRDSDGWEKLGLYEYYKAKNNARKRKEEEIEMGLRERSKSPSPIIRQNSKSPSPPKKRFRSKSRTKSRSKSKSRSRSRSRSRNKSKSKTPPPPTNHRRSNRSSRRRRRNSGKDRSPERRFEKSDRSPTPPSFFGSSYNKGFQESSIDESNKGHQLLRKMGWGGAGLGANEQGIEAPISGGDVRDRVDQYKGIGISLNDPYENFRKSKGQAFITRMKARAEERAEDRDRDRDRERN